MRQLTGAAIGAILAIGWGGCASPAQAATPKLDNTYGYRPDITSLTQVRTALNGHTNMSHENLLAGYNQWVGKNISHTFSDYGSMVAFLTGPEVAVEGCKKHYPGLNLTSGWSSKDHRYVPFRRACRVGEMLIVYQGTPLMSMDCGNLAPVETRAVSTEPLYEPAVTYIIDNCNGCSTMGHPAWVEEVPSVGYRPLLPPKN